MDQSNGYESVWEQFISHRSAEIGVREVRRWAKTLGSGSSVVDLGCGSGLPLTSSLVEEGLDVLGLDASPSLVKAFRKNLPSTPVVCESVLTLGLYDRSFDAVLAWGLMFLLRADEQHRLIARFAEILVPDGRLLFTSPALAASWDDATTGMRSLSLGAKEYRDLLKVVCISIRDEYMKMKAETTTTMQSKSEAEEGMGMTKRDACVAIHRAISRDGYIACTTCVGHESTQGDRHGRPAQLACAYLEKRHWRRLSLASSVPARTRYLPHLRRLRAEKRPCRKSQNPSGCASSIQHRSPRPISFANGYPASLDAPAPRTNVVDIQISLRAAI